MFFANAVAAKTSTPEAVRTNKVRDVWTQFMSFARGVQTICHLVRGARAWRQQVVR